jgi:hypothetical protein
VEEIRRLREAKAGAQEEAEREYEEVHSFFFCVPFYILFLRFFFFLFLNQILLFMCHIFVVVCSMCSAVVENEREGKGVER